MSEEPDILKPWTSTLWQDLRSAMATRRHGAAVLQAARAYDDLTGWVAKALDPHTLSLEPRQVKHLFSEAAPANRGAARLYGGGAFAIEFTECRSSWSRKPRTAMVGVYGLRDREEIVPTLINGDGSGIGGVPRGVFNRDAIGLTMTQTVEPVLVFDNPFRFLKWYHQWRHAEITEPPGCLVPAISVVATELSAIWDRTVVVTDAPRAALNCLDGADAVRVVRPVENDIVMAHYAQFELGRRAPTIAEDRQS